LPAGAVVLAEPKRNTAEIPLAVWPCAQRTSQWQRHGRYLSESNRHPGKMLPALARQAISAYSEPGDLVVDPMSGIGTTLVEAIHLGRRAAGVELEERWARLADENVDLARDQGATGSAQVISGDARELPRLLGTRAAALLLTSPPYGDATLGDPSAGGGIKRARAAEGRRVSRAEHDRAAGGMRAGRYGERAGNVAALPYGRVDLVLTSPPYACEVGRLDKKAWGKGRDLCPTRARNYSADHSNLGHARGRTYLQAMADIYNACAAVLKPGGFLVVVTKDMRRRGALRNLAGDTIALCEQTGLLYWQHVIALLATIRDGELVARPSFWQRMQIKRALERGDRTHLVCHEDVLVFRKPAADGAARSTQACGPTDASQGVVEASAA
jgi:DNA modification methylase